MPVSDADPVRSRTANATAIGARDVPKYETARDAKSNRKFGACSGPVLAGMRPGVALEPGVGLPERHRTLEQLDVVGGCGHLVSH